MIAPDTVDAPTLGWDVALDTDILGQLIPTVAFRIAADGTILMRSGPGLAKLGQVDGDGVGRQAGDFWRAAPEIVEAVQHALTGERVALRVEIRDLLLARDQMGFSP